MDGKWSRPCQKVHALLTVTFLSSDDEWADF